MDMYKQVESEIKSGLLKDKVIEEINKLSWGEWKFKNLINKFILLLTKNFCNNFESKKSRKEDIEALKRYLRFIQVLKSGNIDRSKIYQLLNDPIIASVVQKYFWEKYKVHYIIASTEIQNILDWNNEHLIV